MTDKSARYAYLWGGIMYKFRMPGRSPDEMVMRIRKVWPAVCERYASITGSAPKSLYDPSFKQYRGGGYSLSLTAETPSIAHTPSTSQRLFYPSAHMDLLEDDGDLLFTIFLIDDVNILTCLFECLRDCGPWCSYEEWCLSRAIDLIYVRHQWDPKSIISMSTKSMASLPLGSSYYLYVSESSAINSVHDVLAKRLIFCPARTSSHDDYGDETMDRFEGFLCDDSAGIWIYRDGTYWFGEIHRDSDHRLRKVVAWLLVFITHHICDDGSWATVATVQGNRAKAAAEMDLVTQTLEQLSDSGLSEDDLDEDDEQTAFTTQGFGGETDSTCADSEAMRKDPYRAIHLVTEMQQHYPGYSPVTAKEILDALPRARQDYERDRGRWGPTMIRKHMETRISPTTIGRYLKAFYLFGMTSFLLAGVEIPNPYEPQSRSNSKLTPN